MLRRRDEQGNIVIALVVMLVLMNLSIAIFGRSLSSLAHARRAQDHEAALAVADGGLARALFDIDQRHDITVTGSGSAGSGRYDFTATRIDHQRYEVQVLGQVGQSRQGIRATVRRAVKFPYAIFTNQTLTFNGFGGANIHSYDVPGGAPSGKARIGSNHAIVVNSGSGGGDAQDFFTPSGSCIRCPNGTGLPGPYVLEEVTMPAGTTQPCPETGVFTGTLDGLGGVPYVCDRDVVFSGTATVVNPPFVLYVRDDRALDLAGSVVNQGGASADVQVYKEGDGAVILGNGAHATDFTGVIYAPQADMTVNGSGKLSGSVTANSLKVNGNPNFTFAYDTSLGRVVKKNWAVENWRQVAPAEIRL